MAVLPASEGPTNNKALPLYDDLLREIRTVTAEWSDGYTAAKELLYGLAKTRTAKNNEANMRVWLGTILVGFITSGVAET